MYIKSCLTILILSVNIYKVQAFDIFNTINKFKITDDELNTAPYEIKRIQQPLDQFDVNNNITWSMRYFEYTPFNIENGPIYIYIEDYIGYIKLFFSNSLIYELASATNGSMVTVEPRYYGANLPINAKITEDFKYLTTRQILADIAALIKEIKSKPLYKNSKVVVLGWNLGHFAAWMREVYPELVDAAVAVEAPVLAKKNYLEWLEVVKHIYETYGTSDCVNKIHKKLKRFEDLLKTAEGIKKIKEEENICDDTNMTIPENQQLFFLIKISELQLNFDNSESIKKYCNNLPDYNINKQYENWNNIKFHQPSRCRDPSLDRLIEYAKETFVYHGSLYQTCTEFGQFMTTDSDMQPFSKNVPLSVYLKLCSGIFGEKIDETALDDGVKRTNILYGGRNPNVTAVVFVNAEFDPISYLSVQKNISDNTPAIMIPRTSVSAILFPWHDSFPVEVKETRNKVKYLIKKWISSSDHF